MNFQEIIVALKKFWSKNDCTILQSYDVENGAGTFNPATFLCCLNSKPWKAAYVEASRRPSDGRYGKNPSRLQHYYQFQVIMKPVPKNIQCIYLKSLETIGINPVDHDIRFIEDDWESPTLGACGLGWEVWIDAMEITQFTYFQQIAGIDLNPTSVEITYGIERLAMYIQKKNNVYDLQWSDNITYGEIYFEREKQWSIYNFDAVNVDLLKRHFEDWEIEAKRLVEIGLVFPAYDAVMKCSHIFNLLDSGGSIGVSERTCYISRVRIVSKLVARKYLMLSRAEV